MTTDSKPNDRKVLEIFLYGGLSIWETIWVVGDDWCEFGEEFDKLNWTEGFKTQFKQTHPKAGATPGAMEFHGPVKWGPSTEPLFRALVGGRSLADRCSLIAVSYNDEPYPHGPGFIQSIVYGEEPLGSVINRRSVGSQVDIESHGLMHSYVIRPAFGVRGLGSPNSFYFEQYYASVFSPTYDKNVGHFRPQALAADPSWIEMDQFEEVLDSLPVTIARTNDPPALSQISTQLQKATRLLRADAKHVLVFDVGAFYSTGHWSGYDTHPWKYSESDEFHWESTDHCSPMGTHLELTLNNSYLVFDALHKLVQSGDIDLDTTMILIHSEVGRTQKKCKTIYDHPEGGPMGFYPKPANQSIPTQIDQEFTGRNHCTSASAALIIGGPANKREVIGSIQGSVASGDHKCPRWLLDQCLNWLKL